jgi:hypothetical protein
MQAACKDNGDEQEERTMTPEEHVMVRRELLSLNFSPAVAGVPWLQGTPG